MEIIEIQAVSLIRFTDQLPPEWAVFWQCCPFQELLQVCGVLGHGANFPGSREAVHAVVQEVQKVECGERNSFTWQSMEWCWLFTSDGGCNLQGSHRSWNPGKVLEFEMNNSRPGKVLEFWSFHESPGKILEFKNKGLKKMSTDCTILHPWRKTIPGGHAPGPP